MVGIAKPLNQKTGSGTGNADTSTEVISHNWKVSALMSGCVFCEAADNAKGITLAIRRQVLERGSLWSRKISKPILM